MSRGAFHVSVGVCVCVFTGMSILKKKKKQYCSMTVHQLTTLTTIYQHILVPQSHSFSRTHIALSPVRM